MSAPNFHSEDIITKLFTKIKNPLRFIEDCYTIYPMGTYVYAAWIPVIQDYYRADVDFVTGHVKVDLIGLDISAYNLCGEYASIEDLPKWFQEAIAVLLVTSPTTVPRLEIDQVGVRISDNIFWVYRVDKDGNDTRKTGEAESNSSTD